MKSIAERPPILTIHEDSGDYILRVGDTRYRHLVVGVSKLLPDARRLIVVTPGDVKFFVMGGDGDDGRPTDGDSVPPVDSDIGGDSGSAEEEMTSQLPQPEQKTNADDVEEMLKPKLTRRRKPLNADVKVGHPEKCQRCAGSGVTRTLMPDNSTAESMCQICQGEGTIKRYGARR